MKKTREKILEAALELFNEKGLTETTLRNIAQKVGISQGNLNYYFRFREEIVEELYFELVKKMNERVQHLNKSASVMALVYDSSVLMMHQMYEYRFILRDFYPIMRENKKIRNHYLKLQEQRTQEFVQIWNEMIKQGTVRKPDFPGEYERHYKRLQILGDNWINMLESLDQSFSKSITFYANLLFESTYPYLTTKGKKEFKDLLKARNINEKR